VISFLHHFYPAYDTTIADYAAKVTKQARPSSPERKKTEVNQLLNRKLASVLADEKPRDLRSIKMGTNYD
jgi:hypothetical protein